MNSKACDVEAQEPEKDARQFESILCSTTFLICPLSANLHLADSYNFRFEEAMTFRRHSETNIS